MCDLHILKQKIISSDRYDELIQDQKKLQALEGAGVDNWEGYDFAMEELESK